MLVAERGVGGVLYLPLHFIINVIIPIVIAIINILITFIINIFFFIIIITRSFDQEQINVLMR